MNFVYRQRALHRLAFLMMLKEKYRAMQVVGHYEGFSDDSDE